MTTVACANPACRRLFEARRDHGISRFSRLEVPHMPWFSDRAGPPDDSRIAPPAVLPSTKGTASAPRNDDFAAQ